MSTLLVSTRGFNLTPIVGLCAKYGLSTETVELDHLSEIPGDHGHERAILVLPEPAKKVRMGERVDQLRRALPPEMPLIACAARLRRSDVALLMESGARSVITPQNWKGRAVADRVLGELILSGAVSPRALGRIQGASLQMREVYDSIKTLARFDEPILIRGETGTGKELAANEIHRESGRPGDIVSINVGALSPELVDSELFGHSKGSFTGATFQRKGLLNEADDGTIFLDEIGDLDSKAQTKMLRVLDEKRVRPVGSNRWQSVNARFVFATHRDLEKACALGIFRQDLYERLRGFTLTLPPLRSRIVDLPLLVEHFVAKFNAKYRGSRYVPAGAVDSLFRYRWPGNVRELRQAVRQAAAYAADENGAISVIRLQEAIRRDVDASAVYAVQFDPAVDEWKDVVDRARASYFPAVLKWAGQNKQRAADQAGIARSQIYEHLRKIEGFDID